jgi:hypothetical protein
MALAPTILAVAQVVRERLRFGAIGIGFIDGPKTPATICV